MNLKLLIFLLKREKEFRASYKDIVLKHKLFVAFVIFGKIILEIKPAKNMNNTHTAQC
jgi:GxxExxY protein